MKKNIFILPAIIVASANIAESTICFEHLKHTHPALTDIYQYLFVSFTILASFLEIGVSSDVLKPKYKQRLFIHRLSVAFQIFIWTFTVLQTACWIFPNMFTHQEILVGYSAYLVFVLKYCILISIKIDWEKSFDKFG